MRCDQCEMLSINGVACHETGCPNSRKTWVPDRGEWVLFLDCRECGYPVESGTVCSCYEPVPEAFELPLSNETFERQTVTIRKGRKMTTRDKWGKR
jgi:hypothetical protein